MVQTTGTDKSQGFLQGVRVLEIVSEMGEYAGKVLAGLGADVIKIEPPGGSVTRRIGPFYQDKASPDGSLYFWTYNFGKRSVTLDLEDPKGREQFKELVKRADVVLETTPRKDLARLGLDYASLKKINPQIIVSRITAFGDDGPYADYKTSDLIHLALGGVMMNNGYDALPDGTYETPPIAPQMWQSYHIAGEMANLGVMGALYYRRNTGVGQLVSTAVHDAVSKQTEGDVPHWIYAKKVNVRQTCRHSQPDRGPMNIALTKDGRWIMPALGGAGPGGGSDPLIQLLDKYGMVDDLKDPKYKETGVRQQPAVQQHMWDVVYRFVGKFTFDREIWREAQDLGMVWGPERKPEENLEDKHWSYRQTFMQVEHPEIGKTFTEIGAKWMCQQVSWRTGPRAPLLGEHNAEVLGHLLREPARTIKPRADYKTTVGKLGKPWALGGVRIIDLSWLLASGGASRYLSAMGAEVIKVEHLSRPDFVRWHGSTPPAGGKAERDRLPGPINMPRPQSPNRSGFFNEINAGRRSLSLNLTTEKGKDILRRLLKDADIVAEGFTPTTMDRMGFGWKDLQKINPGLIYIQQSGMGQIGTYGRSRSFGPIAAAFSGMSEMSGLPEPYPPAGIGYSFLDWFGGYNMATAMMAALNYKQRTGKGIWVDSSQVESGTALVGTSILDFTANGRPWRRYGNRSPYKPAAPHGAYRAQGDDRWVTIGCFTQDEWRSLVKVLNNPAWTKDTKFATLKSRLANQDALDAALDHETRKWDRYKLQDALQAAGVPAAVCQTAEDRYEYDPQLKHLKWMTDLKQTEIGVWPVKEHPAKLSETPPYMGGIIDRHGPNYGEDNEYVLTSLLGFSKDEIKDLAAQGVF